MKKECLICGVELLDDSNEVICLKCYEEELSGDLDDENLCDSFLVLRRW